MVSFIPQGKGLLAFIGYEAGWAPDPFEINWRGKNLTLTGNLTQVAQPDPITIPDELSKQNLYALF